MVDKSKIKIPVFYPVDLNSLPMKLPRIEIDESKCTVPFWCKKCLEACPHLVFWVETKRDERLKETDPREPGLYRLLAVRRDKCTLCNRCVELCPEGAITITYEGKVFKGKKTADTAKQAKESPYPRFVAPEPYSFDLNEDMLNLVQQEFDPKTVVDRFSKAA
ncbi:MAG: 4Fe-4S binding protein, partial [Dehalococcoidales bacterium]|nr:4Fe-4S binding protein [Dehalococcoidales bacterium]